MRRRTSSFLWIWRMSNLRRRARCSRSGLVLLLLNAFLQPEEPTNPSLLRVPDPGEWYENHSHPFIQTHYLSIFIIFRERTNCIWENMISNLTNRLKERWLRSKTSPVNLNASFAMSFQYTYATVNWVLFFFHFNNWKSNHISRVDWTGIEPSISDSTVSFPN